MSGWAWFGLVVVAVLAAAAIVLATVSLVGDRSLADECLALGGVPVQSDGIKGPGVVCLDPSVVIP